MFNALDFCSRWAIGRAGFWRRCGGVALAAFLALLTLGASPAQALPPGAYTSVVADGQHACGLLNTGNVQCWGGSYILSDNTLGNNSTAPSSSAVDVIGVANATALAVGLEHSCALIADGRVRCWGNGIRGVLGVNSIADRPTGVLVSNITTATAISARGYSNCALLVSGDVSCWGNDVPSESPVFVPTLIAGFAASSAVSVGRDHVCAVRSGQVWCRGANAQGQLGNNSTAASAAPVLVVGITGVTAVSAGDGHTCALASGAVYCWGKNSSGQIGDGTVIGPRLSPVLVAGLSGVVAIQAAFDNSCAVLAGGALRCWGANFDGRLGNSSGIGSNTPVAVHGIVDAQQVAMGEAFSCVLRVSGTVDCWGRNNVGQLGNGATLVSTVPVVVGNLTGATSVAAGAQGACAVSAGGALSCWGENRGDGGGAVNTGLPVSVAGITNAAAVSVGSFGSCVRPSSGVMRCWGENSSGQLATGNTTPSSVPVASVTAVSQVSSGDQHGCAIVAGGFNLSVRCWGNGLDGQLGNGLTANSSVPVSTGISGSTIAFGSPFPLSVAAGDAHSCAVLSSGAVLCWGAGSRGAIGNGTASSNVPITVAMPSATPATQVTAGVRYSCARLTDGRVACWGDNASGQLGRGTISALAQPTPVAVIGITNAISVAATAGFVRGLHTCALLADGRVKCWGDNDRGQLGNGSTERSAEPVFVSGIGNATQIAVGAGFSCALLADGLVKCWGENTNGTLGEGSGGVLQLLPTSVLPTQCSMDVDGDGTVNPTTDGLLITRAAAGMSGATVTNNAIGAQATRRSWSGIRNYLSRVCGMQGLAP
jgi:alpha-tubulin suppressor-like RCC1 family protein